MANAMTQTICIHLLRDRILAMVCIKTPDVNVSLPQKNQNCLVWRIQFQKYKEKISNHSYRYNFFEFAKFILLGMSCAWKRAFQD